MNRAERENIQIEKLVQLAREKSDSAFETLADYYYPAMIAIQRELLNNRVSLSYDDAMQAGKIGLYNAVCHYRNGRNMNFNNFARLCIKREMQSWIRRETRFLYNEQNPVVSLDYTVKDQDDICYVDTIPSDESTPEEKARCQALKNAVFRKIGDDTVDGKIMNYRMQGYSYRDISQLMNVKEKFVDNSLRKSRRKIITLFD